MPLRVWSWLVSLSILWGGSFFFAKVAVGELGPLTVAFVRVALAALALGLILTALPRPPLHPNAPWRDYVVMGFLNNALPFSLIFWGQTEIASGLAAILNATTPLFTVVLAHFFTRDEPMSAGRLGGVLVGLAGVAVMIGPGALKGLGLDVLAQIAVLGAALSYACAGIFGRHFRGLPPLVTATGQVTATTLMMLPLALVVERPWQLTLPGALTWTALLGLALICTALAYVLYFRILATAGATNLLLVTFLIPVSALLLGISILGEQIAPRDFTGMALIGLGLAAIDGRPLAWLGRGV